MMETIPIENSNWAYSTKIRGKTVGYVWQNSWRGLARWQEMQGEMVGDAWQDGQKRGTGRLVMDGNMLNDVQAAIRWCPKATGILIFRLRKNWRYIITYEWCFSKNHSNRQCCNSRVNPQS
jgi:hypothetical protein